MDASELAEPDLLELALSLEAAVWEALKAGDSEADAALLADDFLGVYPTGFASRSDHAEQLEDGPTVRVYAIETPVVAAMGSDDFRLSYEAAYQRTPTSDVERMYVTSIWTRRSGSWVNTFSQDTSASGEPVV